MEQPTDHSTRPDHRGVECLLEALRFYAWLTAGIDAILMAGVALLDADQRLTAFLLVVAFTAAAFAFVSALLWRGAGYGLADDDALMSACMDEHTQRGTRPGNSPR